MPTEVYQFYIAPGSSNVSITAALFGVGGVTLDIETTAASVATGNWEPFSVARSEIGALSAGATIDFGSRKFAASFSDHEADGIVLSQDVGISGGRFSLGKTASWSSIGDGVYEAIHDFSAYRSPLSYVIDGNATSKPKMSVDPTPPLEMDPYRFVYNGNWWIVNNSNKGINNGVVHTAGGDNNSGSSITGWTITDASLKAEINGYLAGVTATSAAGPWALIHSSANTVAPARITHWDNSTGGLTLESFGTSTTTTYSGTYLEFALCGLPGQTLQSGEYMYDFTQGVTTGRVLYKPVNGNADDARIPVTDYAFKLSSGNTYTFEHMTLEGQAAIGSAPGAFRDSGECSFTFKNSTITDGSSFFRINYSPAIIDKCILRRSTARAGAVVAGVTLTNSIVFHIEGFSGFLIQCQDGVTAIPHTYVENNLFSLEASTHGQGMSLYKDAWRNATVKHNIFWNCQRPHSFQPATSQRPNTEAYEYTFENNLAVNELVLDIQGFAAGQEAISFNGSEDSGLSGSNGKQKVNVRYNTLLTTDKIPTSLSLSSRRQLSTFDLDKIKHSTVVVEGNIAGNISASPLTAVNGGHTHAYNLCTIHNSSTASIGLTDKLVHPNRDDYLEVNTLQGKTVDGGAVDGGALGVRWSTIPTSPQITDILNTNNVNWASTYPALSLPTGSPSWSNASEGKQEYGLTGGGTGDWGGWASSAASYTTSGGGGIQVGPSGLRSLGATGYVPGYVAAYCSPAYAGANEMFLWGFSGRTTDKLLVQNGISADYLRLQVTVVNGGSGESTGYHAGATGQIYNYYWWPSTVSSFTSDAIRWSVGDLGTGSDEWPNSGRTGSLWGSNCRYTFSLQSTPFS